MDFGGDGAALADADFAVVDFADGCDFCCGAGEKHFVGGVKLVAGDAFFNHRQAHFFGDGNHALAGDAVERHIQGRGVELAFVYHENVFARAFGHIALRIEQNGFVVAVAGGFGVGQNRIQIVAVGFGFNHVDIRVVAGEAAHAHADAAFHALFAQIGAPRPGGQNHLHIIGLRRHAELGRAIISHRAEIARMQIVGFHHIDVRLVDFVLRVGQLHAEDFGRVKQALGVLLQAENRRAFGGFISAHAFKHAHAVVQGVGEHVGFGVAPFY